MIGRMRFAVAALGSLSMASSAGAQQPEDVVIDGSRIFTENVAASADGALWFGSMGQAAVFRAGPGSKVARLWVSAGVAGVDRVMGLLPDEPRGLLWVCLPGSGEAPTTIRTFDLATAAPRTRFAFAGGGRCNDLALAKDGTVYASDFEQGRVLRWREGEPLFSTWAAGPELVTADGLALLQDGALYVTAFRPGALVRIPVEADGRAGLVERVLTDRPLALPDGLRAAGPATLLIAEGAGRLVAVRTAAKPASVCVVRDGIPDTPTGVALIGGTVFLVQGKWAYLRDPARDPGWFGAIAIPYDPGACERPVDPVKKGIR